MNPLIVDLPKHSKYIKLLEDIKLDSNNLSIIGLTNSQKVHMVYSLAIYSKKNAVIVCSNVMQAKKMIQDLKFYSEIEILYFPAREIVYYDIEAQSREFENQRMYVVQKILSKGRYIIVTTIDAILQKMLPFETYDNLEVIIKKNDILSLSSVVSTLDKFGYVRTSNVEGKGQFSVRGGILDIFPIESKLPYRIELFGDQVDSIRTFDSKTQRSIDNIDEINISYASEFLFDSETIGKVINKIELKLEDSKIKSGLKKVFENDIKELEERQYEGLVDKYFDLLVKYYDTFLDYVQGCNIYIDEPTKSIQKSKNIVYENEETIKMLAEKEYIHIPFVNKYLTYDDVSSRLKQMNNTYLEIINTDRILHAKRKEYSFSCREVNFFRGSMDILIQDIKRFQERQKIILLVYPTLSKVELIFNQLIDNGVHLTKIDSIGPHIKLIPGKVYITHGIMSGGFEYEDFDLCVVAEPVSGVDLNNETEKQKRLKKSSKNSLGVKINSFDDLNVDDLVVHENHGIGRYKGIHTVKVQNVSSDYIKIEYAHGSMLYVPISQLDSVKKYMCDDNTLPKLNILGGKEWQNTKSKVNSYVKQIAKELIILYAKRQNSKGFKFSEDTHWQREFEDTFKYELTDDQKVAIEEIKADMEQEMPMDRLLCGDVGYGKTELALRAAFKAVMDSKQVAYLVPTTVLSLQQFRTFKERMQDFSINVEMLSRFKTKKEQHEILKRLVDGRVDVVIGTHRLLSKDVFFKDLGLLVIDEEHRFGVKDKESIKALKENIDVLSMTATPIPRTLHMSMIGIRQMSTLTIPPLDRMPVHSYVLEYNEEVIKEAIEKEILRNGQVFYIYNKVEDIEDVCSKVKKLVPDARVAYAHGQMSPNEIENIMIKFIEHELDVIVCTTILESGIDIQNANTIIIEDADKLGLAQLYQIRGRVGRSNRLAYAYITYRKNKQISEVAEKRLKAIKDFTEFGSGYKIALRDLEIRGAGNLLGAEQHGHMAMVGYELYVAMLEKAINDEKIGADTSKEISLKDLEKEVKIDLNVNAYISSDYITDITQKIMMYQKISNISNEKEMLDVIDELLDRFSDIPKETENLIKIVEIRNKARKLGINKIFIRDDFVVFEPINNKFRLTNSFNSDILLTVQNSIKQIEKVILYKKE